MKSALCLGMVMAVGCDGTFGLVHVDPPASTDGSVVDSVNTDTDLSTGLIAHYPMNAIAGGILTDAAGTHDGMCTACPVDIATGKAGDALRFNGTSDIIDVPPSAEFSTTSGLTVAVWLRLETSVASGGSLCPVNLQLGTDNTDDSWELCAEDGHQLNAYWYGGGDARLDGPDIGEDVWHHVALRWDGTTLSMMVDRNVPGIVSLPANLSFSGGALTIGADRESGAFMYPWDGSMDELRIYNRALSDAEIANLPGF